MTRPIRISIHALGGQGGGVLADWIVDMAEHEGWTAQSTSVPGVAQRTGATLYYVELAPPSSPAPVMALMPTPGDVDIVLAAELMEAGRAIARGLVTPERTVLIASSHRVFAISEKMAMGNGAVSPAAVLDAARRSARRLALADFARIAERHGSVISASLFGGLAGAGALPFPREAFEGAIRRSGRSVNSSLAAFAEGMSAQPDQIVSAPLPMQPEGARLGGLAAAVQPLARLGEERLVDYQDRAYAELYLARLQAVAAADRDLGGEQEGCALTLAAARRLALWMGYEDAIRVADLKTRPARLERARGQGAASPGDIAHVTEFLHPRFEEICDTLPRRWGERLLASERARRLAAPLTSKGRFVSTTRLSGFLLLWCIARLRRFRRGTLRFSIEQERIDAWLGSAINAARTDYALGVQIIELQSLLKGYGETHARGWRNFCALMAAVPRLQQRPGAAANLAELREAALKDDEGAELGRAFRRLGQATGVDLSAPVEVVA